LARRPLWQKAALILSSIPIAIACNVGRIVFTASLYGTDYEWMAVGFAHDFAGLLMMPAAVVLILLELRLLSKITPPGHHDQELETTFRRFGGSVSPGAA
jgi:exosortase/archaeosortase family protein